MNVKAIIEKLHSKDLYSWIAHGVIGFALTAVFGVVFMLGAFVYREASDLLAWWVDPRPAALSDKLYRDSGGACKRPFTRKLRDGFFDLWAPMAGAAIALILFG